MNENYLHHANVDLEEWTKRAEHLLRLAKGEQRWKLRHTNSAKYQRSLRIIYFMEKAENFIQAAEAFRVCGRFLDAGAAYSRAASLYEHQIARNEPAALLYTEAGLCLEKIETSQGSDAFGKGASLYCEIEQYSQVGRLRLCMADNSKLSKEYVGAVEHYLASSKFFMADDKRTPAIAALRYAAELLYRVGDYNHSSKLYADVGGLELYDNLTKFQARQSFFLSGLLLLVGGSRDFSRLKEKLLSFTESDALFKDSPQYIFLYNIMAIIESGSIADLAHHVYAYNCAIDVDKLTLEVMEELKKFFDIII